MKQEFTAIYEKADDWWIASAVEISGAHSQGRTLDEARENLLDAVRELILARRELIELEIAGKDQLVREQLTLDIS